MKLPIFITVLATAFSAAHAQNGVTVHGSVQADALFPEKDYAIGTETYKDKVLTNDYATLGLFSKYVDAGFRVEYLEHPLPGFEPDFKGWGVPNIFVKGKYKGFELTAGDIYEQFGSGLVLRTYEDRSLGVDNSIRGGRLKVTALRGFRFTALGGVQRVFWDWSTRSQVYAADAEWDAHEYSEALKKRGIVWTFGASYVMKHEDDEEIMVPGTNSRLNLPKHVSAFAARTHYYRNGLDLQLEYAWKGQDPSYDNNYTYGHGSALVVSGSYSKPGWSVFLQGKRSDNMAFRSRRTQSLTAAFINNLPPFAYQHTYALAAMYPYATQAAPGEYGLQGAFAYAFKRGTALGGKYGTKLKLNASYICGIDRKTETNSSGNPAGTNWHEGGLGKPGDTYYADINLQIDKRVSRSAQLNFMYMFQKYNQQVIEGHGGMVNSNIFVAEGKFKLDKKLTLRAELQYLQTPDDKRDWCYGLAELSVLPYIMITVSDQWNHGTSGLHYYMGSVTGTYRSNRLMVGYGRTRAGYNCSGGVCRYVPASRGFQIAYTYNF